MSYHKDDCMYFVLLSLSKCLRPYHIFCSLVDTGNRSESMKLILNSELYPEFYPEHLQLPPSIGSSQHLVATKSLVRPVLVTSLSYWNCLCLTDSREMKAYDIYLAFQLIHLSNVTGVRCGNIFVLLETLEQKDDTCGQQGCKLQTFDCILRCVPTVGT